MKRKIVFSGIAATTLFTLIGCGGGGGSNSETVGRAYYLDSAVAGVEYQCGSHKGVTDANGTFIFEKGKVCHFYLGDLKLKSLDTSDLQDGDKVVENNITIATILQTLDIDGNPENGITITSQEVKILTQDDTIKTLPKTENELETLVTTIASKLEAEIPDYKGRPVTPEEAKEHLLKTQKIVQEAKIKKLLVGKTLYVIGREEDDSETWYYQVTFNNDLTSVRWTGLSDNIKGKNGTSSMKVEGNKIIWLKDNSYSIIGPITKNYIELTDYEADGSEIAHTRIYFDKTKADTYYQSLAKGGAETFKFTPEYLKNKTFYYVKYDDFGYDDIGKKWNMAKIHFNEDTFTWTEYNTPDTGTYTFHYTVTKDGAIKYEDEDATDDASTGTIYNPKLEDDRIEVCVDDGSNTDCDTYLFFDEAKAKDFVKQHNAGTSDDKGDEDYVTHGKTTGVVTYHPNVAQIDKVEFDSATNELKIYFNQPMRWGSHTTTTGDYVPDTKAGGFGEDGKLFVMKFKSYKPKGVIHFSAGYFKSQNDGQETKAFSITFPE